MTKIILTATIEDGVILTDIETDADFEDACKMAVSLIGDLSLKYGAPNFFEEGKGGLGNLKDPPGDHS